MTLDIVVLNPDHPDRPVDWRWKRCLAESEGKISRLDDAYVRRGRAFYDHVTRYGSDISSDEALYTVDPPVYLAWSMYSAPASPKRYELEARILAQENFDDVSKKMAISKEAIIYYEALFFNVHDRIGSPSYIIHNAIGNIYDMDVIDEYSIWKLYGYWCGPEVVDIFVYKRPPRELFGDNDDPDSHRLLRAQIQLRVYTLLQQTKLRGVDDLEFALNSYIKLQQLSRDQDLGRSQAKFLEQINEIMRGITWRPDEIENPDVLERDIDALDNYVAEGELPALPG